MCSQETSDCDNHLEIQYQDPERVYVQVYHSVHHKGQVHLKMQLSSDYFHVLEYPQSHIFDDE